METVNHRVVFFHEVEPGHWIQVLVRGDFDCDVWHALDGFLKRKATRPAETTLSPSAGDTNG